MRIRIQFSANADPGPQGIDDQFYHSTDEKIQFFFSSKIAI